MRAAPFDRLFSEPGRPTFTVSLGLGDGDALDAEGAAALDRCSINRDDVAPFLVRALTDRELAGRTVGLFASSAREE